MNLSIVFIIFTLLFVMVQGNLITTNYQGLLPSMSGCDIGDLLNIFFSSPKNQHPLQVQALRRGLFRIIQSANINQNNISQSFDNFENTEQNKRSYSSLTHNSNLPYYNVKRSIVSIAHNNDLSHGKRNLILLTRDSNFPLYRGDKLSYSALVRNDNLPFDDGKRSLASLAHPGNMPVINNKRSLEALARSGYFKYSARPLRSEGDQSNVTRFIDLKRSVTTLVKNDQSSNNSHQEDNKESKILTNGSEKTKYLTSSETMRNIQAMIRDDHLNFQRNKQQAIDELLNDLPNIIDQ